jgi:hemoglobin
LSAPGLREEGREGGGGHSRADETAECASRKHLSLRLGQNTRQSKKEETMRKLIFGLSLVVICGTLLAAETQQASLYKRLGGYDALAAVTDDFIGRLASDKSLSRFFVGHSKDSLGRIRQLIVDQLCAATGGPCVYIGRDMKAAHQGMGITEADWNSAVGHLTATLDKFKVPEKEKNEVFGAVSSFKKDIVESK